MYEYFSLESFTNKTKHMYLYSSKSCFICRLNKDIYIILRQIFCVFLKANYMVGEEGMDDKRGWENTKFTSKKSVYIYEYFSPESFTNKIKHIYLYPSRVCFIYV